MFTSFYDKNAQEADQSSIRKTNRPTASFFDSDEEMFSIKTNRPISGNLAEKSQGQSQYSKQPNDFNNNNNNVAPSSFGLCSAPSSSGNPSRSNKNNESLFKKYKATDEISSNLNDDSPVVSTFVPNKRLEASMLELESMFLSFLDLYSESRDKLNSMQEQHLWLRIQMIEQDLFLLPKSRDYSDAKITEENPGAFEEIEYDFLEKMNLMIGTHDEMMINFNALNIEIEDIEDY